MAYIPSECTLEQYEEQIYSGETDNILYIKHGNTIIGTEQEYYASPYASFVSIKRKLLKNGDNTFSLKAFVSQELELTLHEYEITNLTEDIDIKIGTYIDSVSQYVYVPIGIFKVQDNPTKDNNETTYTLRDKSVNFDFYYNGKTLIDNSIHVDEEGNKYVTKLEVLLDICNQAGITYVGSQTFIGYNDRLAIYDNSILARVYVSMIAEQSGCIATMNRYGNLTFIEMNINNLTTRVISEDIVESFNNGDDYEISKVVYESGAIPFESGNDTKDTLFIDSSNPYITKQEDIDRIYNIVNNFKINSFSISKMLGNPTIDPWDIIQLTYENVTYRTLAQYELDFTGAMLMSFDTTIEYEAKQSNLTINSLPNIKKGIKSEIDNINASLITTITNLNETNNILQQTQATLDSQGATLEIISRNVDEKGNITEVTTTNGIKLDKNGLNLYSSIDDLNTQMTPTGTYYRDGDEIISQTTKDNVITRDLVLYGRYYYGVDEDLDVEHFTKDQAMFVGQLYTNEDNEQGFGHFYNGG